LTRKLLVLNLLLAGLIGGAGWYLRQSWLEARRREWQIMSQQIRTVPPPPVTPAVPPPPVQAANYSDVAQKLVFSKDRNPTVEVVVTPPPPMPALPVAHGVFLMGNTPTILLSEKPSSPHKSYRPGDMVGEFKLVAVNNQTVEFEWRDKKVTRSLQEMLEEGRKSAPVAEAAPPPAAAPVAATSTSIGAGKPTGPPPGEGVRPCTPGDTTPAGSVVNGLKKVVNTTPFGNVCRWEPTN
jgi:hypothetical protein